MTSETRQSGFEVATWFDPLSCFHVVRCTCGAGFEVGMEDLEDMQEPWERDWHAAHIENHLFNHAFLPPSNPGDTNT